MKKIIAIASSPEDNSHSKRLLEAFTSGLERNSTAEVVVYSLKDVRIEDYSYVNREIQEHEKEFQSLLLDIQSADSLVIATPTYNFSVPAKLKNMIDRMGVIALDYEDHNIFGQPRGQLKNITTYFIVSGGTPSMIKKIIFPLFPDLWLQIVFWYYGAKRGGSFFVGGLKFNADGQTNASALLKSRRKGERFGAKL